MCFCARFRYDVADGYWVFIDVAVITVAPIALSIGRKLAVPGVAFC